MNFVYANEDHSTIINEKNGVVFITFPKLVRQEYVMVFLQESVE